MAPQLIEVGGETIAVEFHEPQVKVDGTPLLIAVHGGTYSSGYFAVAGGPLGSFLDVASRNGFGVLTIDRPGYGESTLLPEEENSFERQAELVDGAIGRYLADAPASHVVLVGHSIGGMVCLEIAARHPAWPLAGVATTGVGARIPAGGPGEQLGSLPFSGVVDLPLDARDGIMFGPAGSFTEAALEAAHRSYAPTPFVELVIAPSWAAQRLSVVAQKVVAPVQNVLGEHDALWISSSEARAEFESFFSVPVSATLIHGVGHSIDHHTLGSVLHLQQLAFAYSCVA